MSSPISVRARSRRALRPRLEGLEAKALLSGYVPSYHQGADAIHPGVIKAEVDSVHPIKPARTQASAIHSQVRRKRAISGFVTTQVDVSGPAAAGLTHHSFSSYGSPYTAAQIRHAYGVDQLPYDGAGQTIAIVDAYDDPNIASDLHAFDVAMGLPDPVLLKAVPKSGTPAFNSGWAGEIALDVEWAHAMAPKATILLVEARSASYADLMSAVDFAVTFGAKQVSMSWGGSDFMGAASYDSHFKKSGVTFLAAAGDDGAGASYPSASPYVTSVGGTSLVLDANNNRVNEVAWRSSGGGISVSENRPKYQNGFNNKKRGIPDVSFLADPGTGLMVYDTSSGGTWWTVGGTSAGAPAWAGLTALVNQGRAAQGKSSLGTGLTFGTNQALYALAGGTSYTNPIGAFYDVTIGSNGYPATRGYDYVTGLGSPVANKLVPALIQS